MARAGRKRASRKALHIEAELPTVEQLRNGDFERDFVTHAETNTKAMTHRRRDSTIVLKWIEDERTAVKEKRLAAGQVLFPIQAQRFIADCIALWEQVGRQRLTANYGERIASGTYGDGMTQQSALNELHRFKSLLGPYQRHYWTVFENVLRHGEPAGVAGSHYANNPAQRIQSAKLIVSSVATDLAGKLGY